MAWPVSGHALTLAVGSVLGQRVAGRAGAAASIRPVLTDVATAAVAPGAGAAAGALVGAVAAVIDAVTGERGVQTGAVLTAQVPLWVTRLCREAGGGAGCDGELHISVGQQLAADGQQF